MRTWRNPVMHALTDWYRGAVRQAIEYRWLTVGVGVVGLIVALYLVVQRGDRRGVPAPSR